MTKTITTTAIAALLAGATALPAAAETWRGWNIHP